MRRTVRVLASLALAGSGVMLAGTWGAQAASTTSAAPGVLQQAWFWQTAYEQANPPVAAGPAPATEPSGVPEGDLAVAYTGDSTGASSKMSVLAFDLTGVAAGSTVDAFTFSVTLDTSTGAANVNSSAAPVVACLPTRLWAPADGGDYTDEPPVDCSSKAKPTVNGNTYTFTIQPIAQDWLDDQNVGVALVNDPANTQTPFQAVFTGGRTVKATMSYTPAVAATGGTGATGGTSAPAGTTTGLDQPAAQPPAAPAPLPGMPPGVAPAAVPPGPQQAPQVAPRPTRLAPAASVTPSSTLPDAPFWLAAAGLALLVLAASLVLGDPAVPVATASRSRLDRVLRDRDRLQTVLAVPGA